MHYKITVSTNVGTDKEELKKVKAHFIKLFGSAVQIVSKTNVASFKVRKGIVIGYKKTFRKQLATKLLSSLVRATDFNSASYSNNSFTIGISDHHYLKLQPYRVEVPSFGLLFVISLEPMGTRVYRRKYPRPLCKNKLIMSQSVARFNLNKIIS